MESFLRMQPLGLCKTSTVPARLPSPTVTLNVGSGRQLSSRKGGPWQSSTHFFCLFVCFSVYLVQTLMEQETALGVSKIDLRLGRGVEESEHSFKRSIKYSGTFQAEVSRHEGAWSGQWEGKNAGEAVRVWRSRYLRNLLWWQKGPQGLEA